MKRPLALGLGCLFLLIGAIGAVLPVLPTTPFLLVAAYFFAKGDERWHQWLLRLPWAGPLIADWERTRSVPREVKGLACAMVVLTTTVSYWLLGADRQLLQFILLGLATTGVVVILLLPTRPR